MGFGGSGEEPKSSLDLFGGDVNNGLKVSRKGLVGVVAMVEGGDGELHPDHFRRTENKDILVIKLLFNRS